MIRFRWLHHPLMAAALVVGLGAAAQAQTNAAPPPKGDGPRLSEAQKKLVFPETRSLAVQDHQARIAILQRGERCIAAALDGDGLRACMRQERDAIQTQRQQHRQQLRQVFQRHGIAVPKDSKRPAGPTASAWDHPRQAGQAGEALLLR